ncbi:hypothetical protein AB2M62_03635 [Sphingomonas sp. MMS12-HWE2-04]|uniref:hypothetical protein n=1 Tax=Sphingomonas sp. MMS12-HWE2-04 TaxID=3234199 RepID=UPI00384B47DD
MGSAVHGAGSCKACPIASHGHFTPGGKRAGGRRFAGSVRPFVAFGHPGALNSSAGHQTLAAVEIVMQAPRPFVPELIDCIASGRTPGPDEVRRVADSIRSDLRGSIPAFGWNADCGDGAEQAVILRVAAAALSGS